MSYVYMRALETAPERYDKGIGLLGWGQLDKIRIQIADEIASVASKVLEIGVGTGTQALLLAKRGLNVTGIDHSSAMLAIAQKKLDQLRESDPTNTELINRITLKQKAAVQLDEFPPESFDVVTATLVFSELWDSEQKYVLANSYRLLKPGGLLVLADEVIPASRVKRLLHWIISAPLKAFTYLLTQTSTRPVRNLKQMIVSAGFEIVRIDCYQLDSFQVIIAKKPEISIHSKAGIVAETISPPNDGLIAKVWQTAARMIRHPTEIGLLPVNDPTSDSPVLCTCNFKLTVSRLYSFLKDNQVDAWILVAPTDGINVWCAACGGDFNAGSVITAIKISGLSEKVTHRTIILPQLAAPGVDPNEVRKITGWNCVWGPVHFDGLIDFLHDYPKSIKNKSEQQRAVMFKLPFRLEIGSALAFPMLLILGVPISLILWFYQLTFWIVPMLLCILIYIYGLFVFWPHIPAFHGTRKVAIWTGLVFTGLVILSWFSTDVMNLYSPAMIPFTGILASLNLWPLYILTGLLSVVIVYDADGLTPNLRSSLLARSWNKGKLKVMERWGVSYDLAPYGKISLNSEICNSCGICVDVCPMIVPQFNMDSKKVILVHPEICVNCRACVLRCPARALYLEPETEAARLALERLQQ